MVKSKTSAKTDWWNINVENLNCDLSVLTNIFLFLFWFAKVELQSFVTIFLGLMLLQMLDPHFSTNSSLQKEFKMEKKTFLWLKK